MHDDFESVIYGDFNFEGMRDGADVSELETLGDCECVCRCENVVEKRGIKNGKDFNNCTNL